MEPSTTSSHGQTQSMSVRSHPFTTNNGQTTYGDGENSSSNIDSKTGNSPHKISNLMTVNSLFS